MTRLALPEDRSSIPAMPAPLLDTHHRNDASYAPAFPQGLSRELVLEISARKQEPRWMRELRLEAWKIFEHKWYTQGMPTWGPDLSGLDLQQIRYYARAEAKHNAKSWDEVPEDIKQTFEKLKIPEAERAVLAGVGAQYESENIYHHLQETWAKQGVIFEDFDVAVRTHSELVRTYIARTVPLNDHLFTALHYAVCSGGTFLYVPAGVEICQPLQAYFRMNAARQGQFEHTLIVLEEGAKAHYIEGCSAPQYASASLHAGCVEVVVAPHATMRYSSVENWSSNTYNLNTKRALVHRNATMEWVGGNLGSGVTMLYPCSILAGEGARADHLNVAFASTGQHQDTGAKVILVAPNTRATIVSKSLSKGGGNSTYRGLVQLQRGAKNATVNIECDALLLDNQTSVSDTVPHIDCHEPSANITHEASAGRVSAEVLLYLQSRGIAEETAKALVVRGFLDEVVRTLPLEYASELNRLIEIEMEGSVG
ncbi:Fe-S cluster assembly protein SufB [Candidatus Peribacteria bacterium]|nr:Fe-S cluster assembly protein SufB [Candidatus Peribacteria bacterium]